VNWKQPYTQEWSLDLQRQLAPSWVLDVGYYGSKGTHLIGIVDINQPVPGAFRSIPGIPAGPITSGRSTSRLNFVRPFQGFDAINIFSPIFDSNYHGLQTQLQKRFRGNSLIVLNYTWSRAMTDAQSDFRSPQNTYDIRAEYGPAQFDRRHVFNVSYVY